MGFYKRLLIGQRTPKEAIKQLLKLNSLIKFEIEKRQERKKQIATYTPEFQDCTYEIYRLESFKSIIPILKIAIESDKNNKNNENRAFFCLGDWLLSKSSKADQRDYTMDAKRCYLAAACYRKSAEIPTNIAGILALRKLQLFADPNCPRSEKEKNIKLSGMSMIYHATVMSPNPDENLLFQFVDIATKLTNEFDHMCTDFNDWDTIKRKLAQYPDFIASTEQRRLELQKAIQASLDEADSPIHRVPYVYGQPSVLSILTKEAARIQQSNTVKASEDQECKLCAIL